MRRFRICALGLLVGCAQGGKPGDGFHGGQPDGGGFIHIDADPNAPDAEQHNDAAIDTPPGVQQIVLSQTTGTALVANNSVACFDGNGFTKAATYYRVFDLSKQTPPITADVTISVVSFQVEDCQSLAGNGTAVAVRVGTYTGTVGASLQTNLITILQSNNSVQVPEVDETATATPGATVDVPITAVIPGSSQFVVEVDAPDGTNNDQFVIGTSGNGESAIGYLSSADCGATNPEPMTTAAGHESDILMTVTGTFQ